MTSRTLVPGVCFHLAWMFLFCILPKRSKAENLWLILCVNLSISGGVRSIHKLSSKGKDSTELCVSLTPKCNPMNSHISHNDYRGSSVSWFWKTVVLGFGLVFQHVTSVSPEYEALGRLTKFLPWFSDFYSFQPKWWFDVPYKTFSFCSLKGISIIM